MVRWLVDVPVSAHRDDLGHNSGCFSKFKAFAGGKMLYQWTTISSLLGKVPAIVNFNWEDRGRTCVTYRETNAFTNQRSDLAKEKFSFSEEN